VPTFAALVFVSHLVANRPRPQLRSGLPDFSWYNIPKRGKYNKLLLNIPNGHKIYQIALKYTNNFHRKPLLKFTQIAIFGQKIYHLATLTAITKTFFSAKKTLWNRSVKNFPTRPAWVNMYVHTYIHDLLFLHA
jgi:hypothetical protein